jgi:hypothetical protein
MFTWKPIFLEMAAKLLEYRSKQAKLLSLLHDMDAAELPIIKLKDEVTKGVNAQLSEIDPFTVFAVFNRAIKTDARIEIIRRLKKELQLVAPVPDDFYGIPVVNLQKAWFFPYGYNRKRDDVAKLWDFAQQIVKNSPADVDPKLFERCLDIGQVGLAKLTMGMFWFQPDRYLALDQRNVTYLTSKGFELKALKISTLPAYLGIVKKASADLNLSLPEMSYRAWISSAGIELDPVALDEGFRKLLERTATANGVSVSALVHEMLHKIGDEGENEITNRVKWQAELARVLSDKNYTEDDLKQVLIKLWALYGQQDIMRRNAYFKSGKVLADIKVLLSDDDETGMPQRINEFIDSAVAHGYKPVTGKDKTLPAQLASVLLSSRYPDRFVDFKKGRWNRFSKEIFENNELPFRGAEFGSLLVRAGSFAAQVAQTPTYIKYFGADSHLWKVAGVAYDFKDGPFTLAQPPPEPPPKKQQQDDKGDPMNLILYGPPGTGKTYQTIRRSVALIDGKASEDDQEVKKRFDQLVEQSRIGFVTFHQSYSYEDFVEGIRPVMEDEGKVGLPRYECRDGIFKKMCTVAGSNASGTGAVDDADWGNLRVWKMSLGNTLDPEESHIFEDCIKGGFIAHGAGRGKDFKQDKSWDAVRKVLEKEDWTNWPTAMRYDVNQIDALRNGMKVGDIVVVSYGNHYFRAIGRVTGEYQYTKEYEYPQTRSVKWLRIFEAPQPKERLLRGKAFSQLTLYPLATMDLKMDSLRELLSAQGQPNTGKYVLIIDEINRGNISKILGELITLIEHDKRRGQPYALTVTLPYSQQQFSVPDNLCIVGTMNTADKSIALVDIALRRRFQFEELMPDFNICKGLTAEMRSVLVKLNQRIIVRKDRDHQIGHAYFMKVSNETDFNGVFARQIIPLLQEYFYNDWDGLRYVLGEEGATTGIFIRTVDDGDRKWAKTRWQWAANFGAVSILKQLSKNYSPGASADDQSGQSTN